MKFLLSLVFCFAAAQAGLVGVPSALSYASPYTYSAGLTPVPSVYSSPLAYSAYAGYPSTGLAVPTVYRTAGLGLGGALVRSAYVSPTVLSAPSVYTTLLKK